MGRAPRPRGPARSPGLASCFTSISRAAVSLQPEVTLTEVTIEIGRSAGNLVDTELFTLQAVSVRPRPMRHCEQQRHRRRRGLSLARGRFLASARVAGERPRGDEPALTGPKRWRHVEPTDRHHSHWAELTGPLSINVNGNTSAQPAWTVIDKDFGPLDIQQIGLASPGKGDLAAFFDLSVSVAGLTVVPQGLEVTIPLSGLLNPADWGVGLDGLAISLDQPPVEVSGGLARAETSQGVEYDGMVAIEVAGRGFQAIGAYAQEQTEAGQAGGGGAPASTYTSLFVFVVLDIPLGGPARLLRRRTGRRGRVQPPAPSPDGPHPGTHVPVRGRARDRTHQSRR